MCEPGVQGHSCTQAPHGLGCSWGWEVADSRGLEGPVHTSAPASQMLEAGLPVGLQARTLNFRAVSHNDAILPSPEPDWSRASRMPALQAQAGRLRCHTACSPGKGTCRVGKGLNSDGWEDARRPKGQWHKAQGSTAPLSVTSLLPQRMVPPAGVTVVRPGSGEQGQLDPGVTGEMTKSLLRQPYWQFCLLRLSVSLLTALPFIRNEDRLFLNVCSIS